jgi:hypothetical protein
MRTSLGRIVLAAVVGGILMFVWGFVSHTVLQIGDMGVKDLPSEGSTLLALKSSMTTRGVYFFPGLEGKDRSEENLKALAEKYKAGPRGLIVFDPEPGLDMMSPKQLGIEAGSCIAACLLGAVLLSQMRAGRTGRAVGAMLIGVAAWLGLIVSYWNWYRFSDTFAVSALIDEAAGWLIAGIGMAIVLPKYTPQ